MQHLFEIYRELYEMEVGVFNEFGEFSNGAKAAVIETDGMYGLFIDFSRIETTADEATIVAHEAGHIMTGSTHKLSSPYNLVSRHEYRADKWAIKKLIPKDELDEAVRRGYVEVWEIAEYFNVTPQFAEKAMCYYKR